ncbi:MAG: TIGR03905 family TSCPD domain-containing protein [Solobacterium sp.]|nr:TIGR03905 family TSCPD domain-containing protein [Solobacterium sp.]
MFVYRTSGTCSSEIRLDVKDGRVEELQVVRGCDGNLKGIAALVRGMPVEDVIERLEGIRCGFKNTSCPDQIAKALKAYRQQA